MPSACIQSGKITNYYNLNILKSYKTVLRVYFVPLMLESCPKRWPVVYDHLMQISIKIGQSSFSIYALKGVLPDDHLEYWRKFVLACKILCTRTLSRSNVRVANLLLISFCKKSWTSFWKWMCNPKHAPAYSFR